MPPRRNRRLQRPGSAGGQLAERLQNAQRQYAQLPAPGARDLSKLEGVTQQCLFTQPQENVLAEARQLLADCRSVYRFGNGVVLEIQDAEGPRLCTLSDGEMVAPAAGSLLSNVFTCQQRSQGGDSVAEFPPPKRLVELLLNSVPTLQNLPRIRTYAKQPVFDEQFHLRGPGWYPEAGVLVHGQDIEPVIPPDPDPDEPALNRLAAPLQGLLRDFAFRSEADVVHAVACLLTGLLKNHFVEEDGKPLFLLDGNQRGVGKTLLALTVGTVVDGRTPRVIRYSADEEELEKRIVARVREDGSHLLIFDNAKVKGGDAINNAAIDANALAPEISIRILGKSENLTRPNDLLWFITMNQTKVDEDAVSRGWPIRFYYEGDPRQRDFSGSHPLQHAKEHRSEILAALAGMVVRWVQAGRPEGPESHRCRKWTRIIGGIMTACGFPEFGINLNEAVAEFNSGLDELAALAEAVIHMDGPTQNGLPAREWERFFLRAKVEEEKLQQARSQRSKTTTIGQFLSRNVNREVPIEHNDRAGEAVLRAVDGRSNLRTYYFQIRWDDTPPDAESPEEGNGGDSDREDTSRMDGEDRVEDSEEPPSTPPEDEESDTETGNDEQW